MDGWHVILFHPIKSLLPRNWLANLVPGLCSEGRKSDLRQNFPEGFTAARGDE